MPPESYTVRPGRTVPTVVLAISTLAEPADPARMYDVALISPADKLPTDIVFATSFPTSIVFAAILSPVIAKAAIFPPVIALATILG